MKSPEKVGNTPSPTPDISDNEELNLITDEGEGLLIIEPPIEEKNEKVKNHIIFVN